MNETERMRVVRRVAELVRERYVFEDVGAEIADRLLRREYPNDERALAEAVTAELQSVNRDPHLRLLYTEEAQIQHREQDEAEEYAAMTRWADQTGGGIAGINWPTANTGCLSLGPILFPVVVAGDRITAAMTILADADTLILDLRDCRGGDPGMVAFLCSYLWDHNPVQLSGFRHRGQAVPEQSWTQAYVPGRRYGRTKPVRVLTGPVTFSGGEQLAYDLQQTGRATVVGGQTRGGANPREGFRVHPHLEATISVAASISPVTGTNWEGVGVTPDLRCDPAEALEAALR